MQQLSGQYSSHSVQNQQNEWVVEYDVADWSVYAEQMDIFH